MATLYSGKVDTNSDYEELSTIISEAITQGNIYTMQVTNGNLHIREGNTGGGFYISYPDMFIQWTQGSDDIYLKTSSNSPAFIVLNETAQSGT